MEIIGFPLFQVSPSLPPSREPRSRDSLTAHETNITQIFALLLISFRPGLLLANLLRTNWEETSVFRSHVVGTECVGCWTGGVGGTVGSTSILSDSEHLCKPWIIFLTFTGRGFCDNNTWGKNLLQEFCVPKTYNKHFS